LSGGTNKNHSTPKKGRTSQQKDTSNKRPKTKRKTSSSKKVNASQPKVDGHQVNVINPRSSPHVHTTEQDGGSEDPDYLVLRNHDEFHRVQEISINYNSSGELLTVLQRLSTHAFQPWLLTSSMILILRSWQSVNNAQT
jgi:hypothetical protein